LEKEARLVVNEILAKLNMNEKLIGLGAIVFVVGWLIGFLLATVSYAGFAGGNVFNDSGGTGLGFIGLLGAIALIAILYVKYAPNMKVNWPVPVELIVLIVAAVVGVVALYLLWQNWSHSNDWNSVTSLCGLAGAACPSWPITDWIAVLGVVVGAALSCYGAYMAWVAAGRPTAAAK
jgi:hypothetical protein